ncbi:CvpA family protein [Stratiformator vulcanicus]|uniref:Colicin V production protein n=1 Tax=Stratiformator vulcanicus TaxID=2527980 RepID=A0A517R5L2_9PLAN|nr:CvpA family protein [Stratiformator vulcanicus]QDT39140.1 Colicin V production protein [Stratiformator vulcanicus]
MWYDLVILGLLAFCTIRGMRRGFVWQLAGIAGLVLAFLFAETLSPVIAPIIGVEPPLNRWIAMFIIYIGASFVSFAIARSMHSALEKAKFVEFDRHLGGIFGFVKGTAFALLITFFAVTLSEAARPTVLNSRAGYVAAVVMWQLQPIMPEGLANILDPYLENFDRPPRATETDGETIIADGSGSGTPGSGSSGDNFGTPPQTPIDRIPGGKDSDFGALPEAKPSPAKNDLRREFESYLAASASRFGVRVLEDFRDRFARSAPTERERLVRDLRATPANVGSVESIFRAWAGVSESVAPPAKPNSASIAEQNRKLLGEIAAVYSDSPKIRDSIINEAQQRFSGVDPSVAQTVLKDWKSDLLDIRPDPDPGTDLATPLEARITRHGRAVESASPKVADGKRKRRT